MSAKYDGGSAFPRAGYTDAASDRWVSASPGMTMRDFLTAQCLSGICGNSQMLKVFGELSKRTGAKEEVLIAKFSLSIADAVLEARKQ